MDLSARVKDLGTDPFPLPDDPHDVSDFVRALRAVKVWAGDPSLEVLHRRTGVATSTLSDAFNPQRRRMPSRELVRAIVRACGADPAQAAAWERAWRLMRERTEPPTPRRAMARPPDRRREPGDGADPATGPGQDGPVPRQLPPDVYGFVGRDDALVVLAGRPRLAPATAITGTAGVGKTALAVHWAHQIAGRYPDGQLFLDLRGHAGDPAITPTEALSLLLQSLGVPAERIPIDLHLQRGLYLSILAGRRVLVVLDNVVDVAHVRPLLPGGAHCHALITSRDALTGLVVRDGAARITLDTFSPGESSALLSTHLGPDRVAAEPAAAAQLAGLCAHLPLALRIAAANLTARPNQSIAGTIRELGTADLLGRLHVVGDPESAVAAAFDLSYRSLSEQTRQLFRLLGLVPGPEIDPEAAAILLDRDPGDPVPELDDLIAAHLLFEPSPGRYRAHDLLALYARRQAATEPPAVREAAENRLLSWYLHTTDAATRIILPAYAVDDPSVLALTGPVRHFGGEDDALAWLSAELPNLIAALTSAADRERTPFAWHLAQTLLGFLHTRGSNIDELTVARTGLRAAEAADDHLGRAMCHMSMGAAAISRGELPLAVEEFDSAVKQYRLASHPPGIAAALNNLGDVCIRLGDVGRALAYFDAAEQADTSMEPDITYLTNRALAHRLLGQYAEALRLSLEGLAEAERTGVTQTVVAAKLGLGLTYLTMGNPVAAEIPLQQAHSAAVQLGAGISAYDALAGLVLVCVRTGRTREALTWITSLHELLERGVISDTGDDRAHAAILEAHLDSGLLDEALAIGTPALARYDRAGHRLTALRLRILLGQVHRAAGDEQAARRHWEDALPYAIEQALPEQAHLQALLVPLPSL